MRFPILRAAAAVAVASMVATSPIATAGSNDADGAIRVVVKGLRNDTGRVGCSLFNSPDGFPRDRNKQFRSMWTPIQNGSAACEFKGIPAGTYAVSILHDENLNGKMDFNLIGIPTKGYGFSNDAKATLKAPSFDAASFRYDGTGQLAVPINAVYW